MAWFTRLSSSRFFSASARSRFSYVHGASSFPLSPMTIGQHFEETVNRFPDREAFIFPSQRLRRTYEQTFKDCWRVASGLLALGVRQGDRVGIWSPNYYEWVVTQFACALGGFILVNVNPAYQPDELQFCLKKVGVKALISAEKYKTQDYFEMIFELCPELAQAQPGALKSHNLPDLRLVTMLGMEEQPGCLRFDDLYEAGDSASDKILEQLQTKIQPDDAANIQFTSGTTGRPKGATLSHHNIVNNSMFTGYRCRYHEHDHDIICSPPPLYHCFGCVIGTLASVVFGHTFISPAEHFQPLPALEAVHEEKCTSLYGTPTMFIDMLNHPEFDRFDFSTLRTGVMAGAPCPVEVCRQCVDRLNMKEFTILYGTTENSPGTFQSLPTDNEEHRTQTVGVVHDHVEAKIVDEEGCTVPLGQRGEIWTRGYMVMLGYWNDQEKTDETIGADRWYKTGDIGMIDENGYCRIVGRNKDMIVRGGENVYPTEIEKVMFHHDAVEDVHVIGVPDTRLGEEICAWVRLHHGKELTETELREYCKGKMSHFKIPKYILFKKEDEFPLTVTGKVQKFKMREISKEELGLGKVVQHMSA